MDNGQWITVKEDGKEMDKSVLIYIFIYKESTCVGMEPIIEEYAMIEGTRRSKIKMIK